MEQTFAGKVCVVTGGTQGVGEATARMMAERGAAGIAICGRKADQGQAVAAAIRAAGTDCRFIAADLAQVEDCFAVIDAAARSFGRIDVLANVAGIRAGQERGPGRRAPVRDCRSRGGQVCRRQMQVGQCHTQQKLHVLHLLR